MLKVSFHNPDYPDGIIFDIGGIAVPNGGSTELSEEEELRFYAKYHETPKDYFKGSKQVKVEGSQELSNAQKKDYPGPDSDEVSSVTIIEPGEPDPTIPETDDTGEVVVVEEDGA